jgi:hypothetical protein
MDTNIIRRDAEIRNFLLAKAEGNDIAAEVAREALSHSYESIAAFFTDLQKYGCISGLISGWVYYCDTHAFFDRHYAEIEELRRDLEDCIGQPMQIDGDLKNTLAWFGFERVASQIWEEMGLE